MNSVSVVIPAKNEEDNIADLVAEIRTALEGRFRYEIIYIDDGSTDRTPEVLSRLQPECPYLKVWTHKACAGQSRAISHGVELASYPVIVTLDADGQNDPADIPAMIEKLIRLNVTGSKSAAESREPSIFDPPGITALIAGYRKNRKDTWVKRMSSRIANGFRSRVLKDRTPDTGCGLKVFYRSVFLRLPYFDHMHRFLPALVQRLGYGVSVHEVNHRPRHAGSSKYGLHDRLWVGIVDLLGVMWLQRRCRSVRLLQDERNGSN
jgi:dolichol-phosphate mannosyltransferase